MAKDFENRGSTVFEQTIQTLKDRKQRLEIVGTFYLGEVATFLT